MKHVLTALLLSACCVAFTMDEPDFKPLVKRKIKLIENDVYNALQRIELLDLANCTNIHKKISARPLPLFSVASAVHLATFQFYSKSKNTYLNNIFIKEQSFLIIKQIFKNYPENITLLSQAGWFST